MMYLLSEIHVQFHNAQNINSEFAVAGILKVGAIILKILRFKCGRDEF
jgi:hypothetical protein